MKDRQETLYTVDQAARQLKVSIEIVKLFIKTFGPSARSGRKVMVRLDDLRPWLEDRASQRQNFDLWMDLPD